MAAFSFLRLLRRENLIQELEYYLDRRKVDRCKGAVTLMEDAGFSPQARVFNLQNDKSSIKLGKGTRVDGMLRVFEKSGRILIGDYCYVGENSYVWSAASITIGNRVLISHNVNIHDNNSHPLDEKDRHLDFLRLSGSQGKVFDPSLLKASPIVIHDDVWIGFNSVILKSVTIGQGAIVAAGSFVTTDVPPHVMVAGNPAKVIRELHPIDANTPEGSV